MIAPIFTIFGFLGVTEDTNSIKLFFGVKTGNIDVGTIFKLNLND